MGRGRDKRTGGPHKSIQIILLFFIPTDTISESTRKRFLIVQKMLANLMLL